MKRVWIVFWVMIGICVYGKVACAYGINIPVYNTNVTAPADGNVFVGIRGSYAGDAQAALDRINEIRLEACKQGIKDPRDTSKKLSANDYKPLKWSSQLEAVARIRASEARLVISHDRPSGTNCWGIRASGVSESNEVLAWTSDDTMVSGVEAWYQEKEDWMYNTGKQTGHYTAMINPDNTYIGLGAMTSEGLYQTTVAGRFGKDTGDLDTTMGKMVKDCIQKIEIQKSYLGNVQIERTSGSFDTNLAIGDSIGYDLYVTTKIGDDETKAILLGDLDWSSSAASVVSVDSNGNAKRIAKGDATIKVKTTFGYNASIVIHEYEQNNTIINGVAVVTLCCKNCQAMKSFKTLSSIGMYSNTSGLGEIYKGGFPVKYAEGDVRYFWASIEEDVNELEDSEICMEISDETVATLTRTSNEMGYITMKKGGSFTFSVWPKYYPDNKLTYRVTVSHDYDNGVVTTPPTCNKEGVKTYTCAGCGDTYAFAEPRLAHVEIMDHAVEATCVKEGLTQGSHCKICDEVLVQQLPIPIKAHTWDNGRITTKPTQEEEGEKVYTCSQCSKKKTVTMMALGKEYNMDHVTVKMPDENVSYPYDGGPVKPSVGAIEIDGKEIDASAFVIEYVDNEKPGMAKIVIKSAVDNMTGITEVPFEIVCNHSKTEIDEAVEPTDTTPGLTEGKHCLICGNVLIEQKVISGSSGNAGTIVVPSVPIKPSTSLDSVANNTTNTPTKQPSSGTINSTVGVPKAKGTILKSDTAQFVVKQAGKTPKVIYKSPINKTGKSIIVPATIKVNGVTYQVTEIASNAFKNNKKATKIVIPASVEKLGKNLFKNCKCLKTIVIKSKKLTSASVNKRAFKGVSKKVVVKVPKRKMKTYKKMLYKKGLNKKVKIKKSK